MNYIKILLVSIFILSCRSIIHSQDTDDIGSDNQLISLFIDDTCSAPCWFGIIPGESTSQDSKMVLKENSDLFFVFPSDETNVYSADGLLIDGYVQLYWKEQELIIPSRRTITIGVNDSIVDFILSSVQAQLSISDVITTYGNPDLVSLYFGQTYDLSLIYIDESIVVSLTILKDTEVETFGGAFIVYEVRYFSHSDLKGILDAYLFDGYNDDLIRFVPIETLQCWAEVNDTCISSWWDLPEDKDIDLSPWLEVTPEVEVTSEPIP